MGVGFSMLFKTRLLRALIFAGAVVFGAGAGAALAAPLEAYGRLPLIEDAEISPDGTMIAVIMTDGEQRTVLIKNLAENTIVGGMKAGDMKVRSLKWATSDYLIITASQTALIPDLSGPRREYWQATVYDLKKKKQRNLMEQAENSMNVIYSMPTIRMIDGEPVAIVEGVNFVNNQGRSALFRVKLRNGATRLQEPGFENTSDWVIGADGKAVAQTEYDQRTGKWKLRFKKDSSWPTALSYDLPIDRPWLLGLGRDANSILLDEGSEEDGNTDLKEYPLDGSKPRAVTSKPYDGLIYDPTTYGLLGMSALEGDNLVYKFFDEPMDKIWRGIAKAYPGEEVSLVSWTSDRRRIVIKVENKTLGPAYALVDLDKKSANWIGEVYVGLKAGDVSEVRPVAYTAADGLKITGYLTLPVGKEAKGLPLIVMPHGGPAARDEPGFDWWAQALASRGYAVFQPNFRGSSGFGRKLLEAGYGEFGRKMQTDLSDGVRDLAAKGLIDPKRVCIVGASYGGYAALAGVTLDPGVYRCAAAVAGLSDLKRFMDSKAAASGSSKNDTQRYWSRFLGVDDRRDPDLAAISPIKFVDRVNAPVLLVHGKDDTVVLYDQSKVMYDALRKAGKPVELVTLDKEDHWLSRGGTRQTMLQAVVTFLEKNNPPN